MPIYVYSLLSYTFSTFQGSLSHVLQEYAKSTMHKKLESVAEEKVTEPEPLPTPPSPTHQQDLTGSPTVEKASLPPLKAHSKPTVEAVLKKIKPQVSIHGFFVFENNMGFLVEAYQCDLIYEIKQQTADRQTDNRNGQHPNEQRNLSCGFM